MVLIYIGRDKKEDFLAEEFKNFLNDAFNNNNQYIELTFDIGDVFQNQNKYEKCIALMLCSPFSVRETAIHAQCGELDYYNFCAKQTDKKNIHIIPICHSGLILSDLPEFFSSNQGLVINENAKDDTENDVKVNNFGRSLIRSIWRIIKGNSEEVPQDNFYEYWDRAWQNYKQNSNSPSEEKEEKKNQDWENSISSLIKILDSKNSKNELDIDSEIDLGRDHIGILPFLVSNSDEVFVGLNGYPFEEDETSGNGKHSKINRYLFHSNTTRLNNAHSIDTLLNEYTSSLFFDPSQTCLDNIEKRLSSMNQLLFQFKDNKSIVLLNDSDKQPRFDVCILKFIHIDKLQNNLEDFQSILPGLWIWAKDGVIKYWLYPNESDIPCYIPCEYLPSSKPQFLGSDKIPKKYGWNVFTTPYTSDEEQGERRNDLFTVSARMLLTIF